AVPESSTEPEFLADVIDRMKAKLNELTDAQREAQEWMNMWREALNGAVSAQAFTDLMADAQEAPEQLRTNAKRLLTQAAKKAGYTFDRESGQFVDPAPEKQASVG